ncbi:MAG: TonB family protein [Burkholderiales bacterium]|nr:TonB family protein [Burkholderiales bacterium]
MAAAGALSLAVHAAALFVRVPFGGAAANGAPPAPVLLTRLLAAPEPVVATTQEPALPPAPALVVESPPPPPPAEPPKSAAVAPTPDRDAATARPLVPPPPVPAPEPIARSPAAAPVPQPVATVDASPVAAPPAPAVTYQGAMGLDPPPRPLGEIEPLVPEAAGARGGVVVLRLYINEQGTVDRAEVLRSTPPGLFDASALEAFSHARFSPGYLAGVAVKSQMTFEVKYRALGSGAESSARTY